MANILISENRQLIEQLEIALSTQANLYRILLERMEAKDTLIELLQIEKQQISYEKLELQEVRDNLQDENLELRQEVDSLKDENLELRQLANPYSPDGLSIEDSLDEEY